MMRKDDRSGSRRGAGRGEVRGDRRSGRRDGRPADRQEAEAREERFEGRTTDRIEGRNAVLAAFRSEMPVDKLFVQENLTDAAIQTILREARKGDCIVRFLSKERMNEMSETGHHQGVIAQAAAFTYAELDEVLERAEASGKPPFLVLLDGITDPHNLGAIIRTAYLAGADGVLLPRNRAVGLTASAVRAAAGAAAYLPVVKVTNLVREIEELKKKGIWFVCADMAGKRMYDVDMRGPVGLVVGSEGKGVSRLVREACDFAASIPMQGEIDSLNASVAAAVLMYELVRQRGME